MGYVGKHEKKKVKAVDAAKETPIKIAETKDPRPAADKTVEAVQEKPKKKKRSFFWLWIMLYILAFLGATAAGLNVLWHRMDVYQQSLPDTAMSQWMEKNSGSIRSMLENSGVQASFLDTIDFDNVTYYKKLDVYTEARPAYGIRFGGKTYITAYLSPFEELDYDSNSWAVTELEFIQSDISVYIPDDATLLLKGVSADEKYTAQRDAQSVELSVFEKNREDIHGLKRYKLYDVYGVEDMKVIGADGAELELAVQSGTSYYYAPVESDYSVVATNLVTVYVNGVALTEYNSEITREKLEDFDEIESAVPVVPEIVSYTVRGLLMEPEVKALYADGTEMAMTGKEGNTFIYEITEDEAFKEEVTDRILAAFTAYVNFTGNKNKDYNTNLSNYLKYIVPDSEAAQRAKNARSSLVWVSGRDTTLGSKEITSVIRYGEDMFTTVIDFTITTAPDSPRSVLFIFVKYEGNWRIVRVLNK